MGCIQPLALRRQTRHLIVFDRIVTASAQSAAAGSDLCGECLPGSFTVAVGALGSELYSPGNSKMRLLPHRVSIAQRSSILRQRVVPNAQCFHAIYGSLQFSHSLAPFGILASRCVLVGRS